jgi:hypothetical protein
MEKLGALTCLTRLKLAGLWSVSDKGLAPLACLTGLASLSLAQPAKVRRPALHNHPLHHHHHHHHLPPAPGP